VRYLHLLIVLLLSSTPLYAEQALVLTEIEQIQEKIWYLQRDLSAQKEALEKQKGQLNIVANQAKDGQAGLSRQLESITQTITTQADSSAQSATTLQQIQDSFVELTEKVNQKDSAFIELAGKIGTLEGSLQALRSELAAQQTRHEQALAEVRAQLGDVRSQLDAFKQDDKGPYDQVGLWGAIGGLAVAVLLTIIFALKGSRSKRYDHKDGPSRHEL